jgi:hypothetical protein
VAIKIRRGFYLKSEAGRRNIRRWERERDLDALIDLLEHDIVPPTLVTALRAYRKRSDGLETLLFHNRRGRGGNAAARSQTGYRTDRRYAMVLAAKKAGYRGGAQFREAAKLIFELGMAPTKWKRLIPPDRVKDLKTIYHNRRHSPRLFDPIFHDNAIMFSGFFEPPPSARKRSSVVPNQRLKKV